jgi:hypothetical protein
MATAFATRASMGVVSTILDDSCVNRDLLTRSSFFAGSNSINNYLFLSFSDAGKQYWIRFYTRRTQTFICDECAIPAKALQQYHTHTHTYTKENKVFIKRPQYVLCLPGIVCS